MSQNSSQDNVPTQPLTGQEPRWIKNLPQDNIVAAIFMCVVEITRLRDELTQCQDALKASGAAIPDRDETISAEERAKIDQDISGPIVNRIMGELFRPQESWTGVDPRVANFFGQPAE